MVFFRSRLLLSSLSKAEEAKRREAMYKHLDGLFFDHSLPLRSAVASAFGADSKKKAIVCEGRKFSYKQLLSDSIAVAASIRPFLPPPGSMSDEGGSSRNPRLAFLAPPTYEWITAQLAAWMNGCIAVPLCVSHPSKELEYVLEDSNASAVMATGEYADLILPLAESRRIPSLLLSRRGPASDKEVDVALLPAIEHERRRKEGGEEGGEGEGEKCDDALIIYTSGTTGKPKGVVHTHKSIESQIRDMQQAWRWSKADRILNPLPLHHVHGVVNVVNTALASGATLDMLDRFDAKKVWDKFRTSPPTLFMAVPAIYQKLIASFEEEPASVQTKLSAAAKGVRLMVSGSAALPQPVADKWKGITSHTLLERYGMTETGMALGNPLDGERRAGSVGVPFQSVDAKIVDENGADITETGQAGDLRLKGDSLFRCYLNKPEATKAEFDENGYFQTGDVATKVDGYYSIVGRKSVDIIKSNAYKISALDVERHLLAHPSILEVAVMGVNDEEKGEAVAAIVAFKEDAAKVDLSTLRSWAKGEMAPYKIPTVLKVVDALPRNAMGKVNKKELKKEVFGQ